MKVLYKSRTNRRLSGVLGGLGEYFSVDPTILRLLFVAFFIVTGFIPGILLYIIAAAIVPEEPVRHADHTAV